jgi:hypothetical protein
VHSSKDFHRRFSKKPKLSSTLVIKVITVEPILLDRTEPFLGSISRVDHLVVEIEMLCWLTYGIARVKTVSSGDRLVFLLVTVAATAG